MPDRNNAADDEIRIDHALAEKLAELLEVENDENPFVDPGINQPGAAGNVGVPGASPTNLNGGVNRVGVRR